MKGTYFLVDQVPETTSGADKHVRLLLNDPSLLELGKPSDHKTDPDLLLELAFLEHPCHLVDLDRQLSCRD